MKRLILVAMLISCILVLSACNQENKFVKLEDMRSVCELATLDCYYNNVAKIQKEKETIFQVDRTMWIEYEGQVTIGIDVNEIDITVKGNVVSIKIPPAKVLSIDLKVNESSYVASEDGWWLGSNKISVEDQQAAIVEGQKKIQAEINNNTSLFNKAEARARELLENYIIKFSETTGQQYTIEWIK